MEAHRRWEKQRGLGNLIHPCGLVRHYPNLDKIAGNQSKIESAKSKQLKEGESEKDHYIDNDFDGADSLRGASGPAGA